MHDYQTFNNIESNQALLKNVGFNMVTSSTGPTVRQLPTLKSSVCRCIILKEKLKVFLKWLSSSVAKLENHSVNQPSYRDVQLTDGVSITHIFCFLSHLMQSIMEHHSQPYCKQYTVDIIYPLARGQMKMLAYNIFLINDCSCNCKNCQIQLYVSYFLILQ